MLAITTNWQKSVNDRLAKLCWKMLREESKRREVKEDEKRFCCWRTAKIRDGKCHEIGLTGAYIKRVCSCTSARAVGRSASFPKGQLRWSTLFTARDPCAKSSPTLIPLQRTVNSETLPECCGKDEMPQALMAAEHVFGCTREWKMRIGYLTLACSCYVPRCATASQPTHSTVTVRQGPGILFWMARIALA